MVKEVGKGVHSVYGQSLHVLLILSEDIVFTAFRERGREREKHHERETY